MKEGKKYTLDVRPLAKKEAMVQGDKYRFTVLTEYLIRMEYQEDGIFMDAPTQTVICRDFPVPEFRVVESDECLEIITKEIHLYYDKKPFSPEGLYINLKERYTLCDSIWNYGDAINDLRGTARTLDNANGAIELEMGLMSREGFTVLDDARSSVLTEDGWAAPREKEAIDLYFFGYGHSYLNCLKDFYRLSGATPLLPKYTLGNWWSRYYPYTEESYLTLMKKFEEKDIPVSVSVIDMDWHLTDVPAKYGSAWTGYTWNKKLFPDPQRFLTKLHEMGKRITLNLHPADGVRAFEDAYPDMAKELGVDYENEDKIPFNVTDRKYMEAYFKYLHHPYEEMGVDFWWVDWQQGSQSRAKGIDPLWMLNHLHYMDSGRDGKLPLTFSRYAGLGSHRYPVGFSGDTITTWESLDFQPYFTINATNAGYTWWSHDIGGHQKGFRDDEMVTRWVQFGVFSPIMRMHSTSSEFYGKEPWNYNPVAENAISEFMRLRHKLIPYLHSYNYKTHLYGEPLIQPMYYHHDVEEAYLVPNEYYFGDMIVCPVTKPADKETMLGETEAWLPEGIFYDLFTGQVYNGNTKMTLYRDLDTIPVLVPAGTVIPMAGDYDKCYEQNPNELEVLAFNGGNGTFEMFEDDCSETVGMTPTITKFAFETGEELVFSMNIEEDTENVIPADRAYTIRIRGVRNPEAAVAQLQNVQADGEVTIESDHNDKLSEAIIKITGKNIRSFSVVLKCENKQIALPDKKQGVFKVLHKAQIAYEDKDRIFRIVSNEENTVRIVTLLHDLKVKNELFGAILEQLISGE